MPVRLSTSLRRPLDGPILLAVIACAILAPPARSEDTRSLGSVEVESPVKLGMPITAALTNSETGEEIERIAFRFPWFRGNPPPPPGDAAGSAPDDLPPPISQFDPRSPTGEERPKPFTFDFILIGRAGVDAPSTNVKMFEVGGSYQYRRPMYGDRFLVTLRPFADVLFLSGPAGGLDLPEQLYKIALDTQGDYQITDKWGATLGLTPGFWTDFAHFTSDDFRLPVRILATYRFNNRLLIAGGLIYTDNFYRNLLPGVGAVWDVNDRTRLELLWPRFRAVHRIFEGIDVYGVFERGGDTYNIRTGTDSEDFQYRDLRILLGTQLDVWERASFFAEMGFSFDRRFRFHIQEDADIKRAFFLRAGTRF